jgi:hypothetical protein
MYKKFQKKTVYAKKMQKKGTVHQNRRFLLASGRAQSPKTPLFRCTLKNPKKR